MSSDDSLLLRVVYLTESGYKEYTDFTDDPERFPGVKDEEATRLYRETHKRVEGNYPYIWA